MKKLSGESYIVIVIIAVIVLTVSAVVFFRYLEDNAKSDVTVNSFENLTNVSTTESTSEAPTQDPELQHAVASSTNDILQMLSQSINNPENADDIYKQFTKEQLNGLSLEEYRSYVSMLNEVVGGKVLSYSTMQYSERKTIKDSMLQHNEVYKELIDSASFHYLEFKKNNENGKIPILLSQKKDGKISLPKQWVIGSLELRNFAVLYFSTIKDSNFENLYRLTYSYDLNDEVKIKKTNELLDFYKNKVLTNVINNSTIVDIRMDAITFSLSVDPNKVDLNREVTLSSNLESANVVTGNIDNDVNGTENSENNFENTEKDENRYNRHIVRIVRDKDKIVVKDAVPSNSWKVDAILLKENESYLAIDEEYTFSDLIKKFGEPRNQSIQTIGNFNQEKTSYYSVEFKDLKIILEGSVKEDLSEASKFKVIGFETDSEEFNLGGKYFAKKAVKDLFNVYLYIDTLDFSYVDANDNVVKLLSSDLLNLDGIRVRSKEYSDMIDLANSVTENAIDLKEITKTKETSTVD